MTKKNEKKESKKFPGLADLGWMLETLETKPKACHYPPCKEKKGLAPVMLGDGFLWLCGKHRELAHFFNWISLHFPPSNKDRIVTRKRPWWRCGTLN